MNGQEVRSSVRGLAPNQTILVDLVGDLELHGVKREITVRGVEVTYIPASEATRTVRPGDLLRIAGGFTLKLSDYNIERPQLVLLKLADEVEIEFDIILGTRRSAQRDRSREPLRWEPLWREPLRRKPLWWEPLRRKPLRRKPLWWEPQRLIVISLLWAGTAHSPSPEGQPMQSKQRKRRSDRSPKPSSHPLAFSHWMAELSRRPLLTPEEEIELARRARAGDRAALQRLIECNLRLVVRIAARYAHPNVPLIDLIQEGNIGLIQAAERFDPERGFRFSTYAVWWIRRAILRALSYDSRMIRLPEHIIAGTGKLERQTAALRQELGRDPSDQELAARMRLSLEQVRLFRSVSYDLVSLEGEGESSELAPQETIEDPRQHPDRWWEALLRSEEVDRVLSVLNERDRAILRARFGIDDGRPKTLKETGKLFNLTRERIRQIEKKALRQLREFWRQRSEAPEDCFSSQ
ncbi:MAG: hypothetical protein KatS3mg115_1199 [Candidatus Poribacteria bacterium]|nr:MAG: hypothetical protein KatS3mg115_1199 [Candidatus Poribacteria bacterium]